MPLHHYNLDRLTRHFMMAEIDLDIEAGCMNGSPILTDQGIKDWPALLWSAAARGNDVTLARDLLLNSRTRTAYERTKASGDPHWVRVSSAQVAKLADGAFNHFYVRGLCRRALLEELDELIVYRAAQVETPRPGANGKIGSLVDPAGLLDSLRSAQCLEVALGLPDKPHSGLSIAIHDLDRFPINVSRPVPRRSNLYRY